MKYLVIGLLLMMFSVFAEDEKVSYKEGVFELSRALDGTGLTAKEFFDEFKNIASHQFRKDKNDINYIMLNDFLVGIQDKKVDHDIIKSVAPNKEYNKIIFHMYARSAPNKKIKHREIEMSYSQNTSKNNIVESIITFEYGKITESLVKTLSGLGVLSLAVPEKEIIRMTYHPDRDVITYFVSMKLLAPTSKYELDKTFDGAFEKIQKIAIEKVVPVIQKRLY